MQDQPIEIQLKTEADTRRFAAQLANLVSIGDTLLLSGEIGAGKSFFCRALIQARTGTTEDIPSPTFTLVQTYSHSDGDIWHCDLYRLSSPDEAIELGLDDAFDDAICLVEWPDRLGSLAPQDAIRLHFVAHSTGHQASLIVPPKWRDRMAFLND